MRKLSSALVVTALIGISLQVQAADAPSLNLTIKDHKFEPAELKIPANTGVTIKVKNTDKTPEEIESNDLNIEKVIPGNSEGTIRLHGVKPGKYQFVGEYHEDTARGVFIAE